MAKIAPVYFIYGNVENSDKEIAKLSSKIKIRLPLLGKSLAKIKNLHDLNSKTKEIKKIRIAGYPYFREMGWIRRFRGKDKRFVKKYGKEDRDARKFFSKLGKVGILLVHQPPFKILDTVGRDAPKNWQGKHAGSEIILSYIKRKQPGYVLCGHIHESHGERKIGKTKIINLGMQGYRVLEF